MRCVEAAAPAGYERGFDDLQMVKHENALTEEDIRSALEAYDKEYYNFTISDIEALTDVRIERNKRNGRSQKEHLKRARAVQEVDYPGGTWRKKGQKKRKRKSMRGGRSIQRDARPIVIGTPDLIRKRSAMVGHRTGGAYNGQNTPITGFERSVGGGI